MKDFRDRRDRTTWTYSVPQHVTQPSTPIPHHPYPDPDHSSGSNSLPLIASCHQPIPSSGSPHFHSNPSQPALPPSLPSLYSNQLHQQRLYNSTSGFHRGGEGAHTDQRVGQPYPQSDQVHRSLAPIPPSFTMMSETWFGLVQTPRDAYLLLEACRVGKLFRITRRLTDLERSQVIRPGAVFVWEEKEAGIKRWTDHVRWSPSRVSGAFLIYSELLSASTRDLHPNAGDPLLKQSFSSTTLDGEKLHLIAYYSKAALDGGHLPTPTLDAQLRDIVVPPGIYPDHRATGGVEDDSARERQRANFLPRQPATTFLQSVASASSVDSATSAIDSSQIQPITPTSATAPMSVTDFAYSQIGSLTGSGALRSATDSKLHGQNEHKYSPPSYIRTIYPISQGMSEHNTPISEKSSRWDSIQQHSLPEWVNAAGSVAGLPDHRITYGRTGSGGLLTTMGPTLPPMTSWQTEADRERVGCERRFSAPGTSGVSGNSHAFHPYARPTDSTRDRMSVSNSKEFRTGVESTANLRGLSHEPLSAPGTPNPRGYNLPSIRHHSNQAGATMGPPTPSKSDSPNSTAGPRSAKYANLSPNFGCNTGSASQSHGSGSGGMYQQIHSTNNPTGTATLPQTLGNFRRNHHPESKSSDSGSPEMNPTGLMNHNSNYHQPAEHQYLSSSPNLDHQAPDNMQRQHSSRSNLTDILDLTSNSNHHLSHHDISAVSLLQKSHPSIVHNSGNNAIDRFGSVYHSNNAQEEEPESFMLPKEEPN